MKTPAQLCLDVEFYTDDEEEYIWIIFACDGDMNIKAIGIVGKFRKGDIPQLKEIIRQLNPKITMIGEIPLIEQSAEVIMQFVRHFNLEPNQVFFEKDDGTRGIADIFNVEVL